MNIKEIRENVILLGRIKEIKYQEYLIAENEHNVLKAKLDLYEAEIALKRYKNGLEGKLDGTN